MTHDNADATHDTPKRRRPRICGVMSASGPDREMLACAYKPGHKGGHSWASLPTFPLSSTFAADLMADRMCRKYGGAEHVPSEYRTAIQLIYDALVSADA